MAYTSRQLINESFYISGIVSKGLQEVSGEQIEDGLERLNAMLSVKSVDTGMIPFFQQFEFDSVPGQEKYFVQNLVEAQTLTFNIGTVRYSSAPTLRTQYFGSPRVDGINSLPFSWHFERAKNGADIYLYFSTQGVYQIKIWGKALLTNVSLNQDLDIAYEKFFIEYLKYELAIYLCEIYNVMPPDSVKQRYESYCQICRDVSPLDLSLQKLSISSSYPRNWGDVNLGKGWT